MGPMAGKQTLFIWGFLTTSTPTPSSSQSSEVNSQSQPDSAVSLFFFPSINWNLKAPEVSVGKTLTQSEAIKAQG